jgi:DNA-binding NarL/FixJ family response regulator
VQGQARGSASGITGHDASPVGRAAELEALAAFLGAPWPRLLLVEGPAGIGKSTLLETSIASAPGRGVTPLVVRQTEAEWTIPHAALTSLFPDDRVGALLPHLVPPRRLALEVALRRAEAPPGTMLDAAALGLAVLDGLRRAAGAGPVLLVFDDLQWCDEPSAGALAYALRRAGDLPVGVLAAARTGIEGPAIQVVVGALPADRVERRQLGPLSVGAIGRLLEARTGRARTRSSVVRVAAAAGGNPLLALEIARALDAAGLDAGPGAPLAVPASSEPLLAARLAALSPRAGDAVLAVALGGTRTVAALAALTDDTDGSAVEEAVRSGLLEPAGASVRLAHPLVGAAAVGRAMETRLRALHRAIAAHEPDPVARARHLALAAEAPDEATALVCDAAVDDAERHGAPGTAADLAELAIGLTATEDTGALARRHGRAASLRMAAGELARAREHIEAGVAAGDSPGARSPLLVTAVELAWLRAGRPAAREAAARALEDAGDDPILRALASSALLAWGAEDTRDEQAVASEVLRLLAGREAEAPGAAADALAVLATAHLAAGDGPALDLLERALALDRGRPDFVIGSLEMLAGSLRAADRPVEARAVGAEILERLAGAGYEARRVAALAHAAWTEVAAGDLAAAGRLLDEALVLAGEIGVDAVAPRVYRAHVDVLVGRVGQGREAATAGLAAAETAGDTWTAALWRRVLGIAELLDGDPAVAAGHFLGVRDMALGLAIREPGYFRVDADLVEAFAAAGRLHDAQAALLDFRARAATAGLPWGRAAGARAEAVLAVARGEPEAAVVALDEAWDVIDALPLALERARCLLVRGTALRRVRRVREAREALTAAVAAFDRLPSPPWSSRAASELARLGGRAPSAGTLTPAELQVARLAAEGRSNREIADLLVVGVRTVESQLSAVYGKLGVRSRAGLAGALASTEERTDTG